MISVVLQVSEANGEFFLKSSELFESPVYLEEAADVLCILQAGVVFLYLWCFLTSHKRNKTTLGTVVTDVKVNLSSWKQGFCFPVKHCDFNTPLPSRVAITVANSGCGRSFAAR